MTPLCTICHRPHSGSFACPGCVRRICTDLLEVPSLVVELEVTRCRLDVMGSDPGRSAEKPAVWREKASEAAWVLGNTLGAWARDLWTTWGQGDIPIMRTTPDMSRFILRYPTRLAQHEAVDELADEVNSAIRLARRAIDTPSDSRVFLGRCDLNDPVGEPCGTELWATYPSQNDVICPDCGAEWLVADRRDWLLAVVRDETATAEVMSGLLFRLGFEISVAKIQVAARKGLITNVGIDSHTKRRRYEVGSVLDALLPHHQPA